MNSRFSKINFGEKFNAFSFIVGLVIKHCHVSLRKRVLMINPYSLKISFALQRQDKRFVLRHLYIYSFGIICLNTPFYATFDPLLSQNTSTKLSYKLQAKLQVTPCILFDLKFTNIKWSNCNLMHLNMVWCR